MNPSCLYHMHSTFKKLVYSIFRPSFDVAHCFLQSERIQQSSCDLNELVFQIDQDMITFIYFSSPRSLIKDNLNCE